MGVLARHLSDAASGVSGWDLILAGAAVIVIGLLMLRFRQRVVRAVINRRSSWSSENRFAQRLDSSLPTFALMLCLVAVGYGVVVIAIGLIRTAGIDVHDYTENPTTIQRSGDSLIVAVCSTAHVAVIGVDVRGATYNWKTIYSATGTMPVEPGFTFATDEAIQGLESTTAALDFNTVTEVLVSMSGTSSNDWSSLTSFRLSSTGVPSSGWLHSNGEVSDEPCPSL